MKETVEYLCSPVCLPRNPGTDGGIAARNYLRERMEALELKPAGEHGLDHPIPTIGGSNLLGMIPGSGDRYTVLAAHYDACGWDNPGADDNAAAVAIVLEVAERLKAEELERSVIIALFDAEEPPYFLGPHMGSQWFVNHPTVPLEQIDMMICLDLVGHALGPEGLPSEVRDSVFVLGAEKSTGTGALVDALPKHQGIHPRRIDNYIIDSMSDYDAFMNAEIPFLFYSAGRWEHYHEPTDTPDKLDFDKMEALSHHLVDAMIALSNRADTPGYTSDGSDDEATVSSLEEILESLSGVSPEAQAASIVVDTFRTNLDANGSLRTDERNLIRMLVGQIEGALA